MVHLVATKGHSYQNGDIISKDIYAPNEEEAAKWTLITDTKAEKIKAEQLEKQKEELKSMGMEATPPDFDDAE